MSSILVCGDEMRDRYWYGEVTRISPDAPVPVVKVISAEERRGAAANVAANCRAMGVPTELLSSASKPIEKIRILGKKQHITRVDFDHPQLQADAEFFRAMLDHCELVIFSDYGKGTLTALNLPRFIACATEKNIPVLVDPKGPDWARYAGALMVKPNMEEMTHLAGGWTTETELEYKARKLLEVHTLGAILLTRSAGGMTLFQHEHTLHIEATAKEVIDVSGAGETAIAAFAVAFTRGLPMEECAKYANKAAGIAVSHFGTYVATKDEVFGE